MTHGNRDQWSVLRSLLSPALNGIMDFYSHYKVFSSWCGRSHLVQVT